MKVKEEKEFSDESTSSDTPVTAKKRKTKSKAKAPAEKKVKKEKVELKKVKKEKIEDEEEEEEGDKWWLEKTDNPDGKKWTTLTHNGPLFPPLYEPHGVKMKYNGNVVSLTPDCEEIASFFAALLGTDNANNPTFRKNFFIDFKASLKGTPADSVIKKFEDCDFQPIFESLEKKKAEKKSMTKEEKKKIKEEKEEIDKINGYCYLDGRKEKVGNYRIEPPGLFRGRGEHPKTGKFGSKICLVELG
jgi:DNA topoisomerase-1